jgi:hypothetical protein
MKNFDITQRHRKIIQLDRQTNRGTNCSPFKNEFIDANSINLGQDDTIYRIFSLDKFIKTIQGKKLCLVRTHKWEDPFENFLLNSVGQLDDGKMVGFDTIREKFYGQCWTLKKECDGLWRNYKGAEPSAIKVKTTVGKLMQQFYDITNQFHQLSYFIGKVEYVTDSEIENYFKNEIDIMHFQSGVEFAQTLLIKRLSFSYEEEVRIIFSKPSTDEIDLSKVKNTWDYTDYFFVNIDPNTLFEEIEIDPWLPKADYEALKQQIIAAGYTGHITRSSLYDKPFFVTKIKQ